MMEHAPSPTSQLGSKMPLDADSYVLRAAGMRSETMSSMSPPNLHASSCLMSQLKAGITAPDHSGVDLHDVANYFRSARDG